MSTNNSALNRLVRSEGGLTLLEIIFVLVILAVVMSFLISKISGGADRARADLTRSKLIMAKASVEEFRLRYNALPSTIDELYRCSDRIAGCVAVSNEDNLKDAWGTAFIFRVQDEGRKYEIKSLGADARDGGDGVNFDISVVGP